MKQFSLEEKMRLHEALPERLTNDPQYVMAVSAFNGLIQLLPAAYGHQLLTFLSAAIVRAVLAGYLYACNIDSTTALDLTPEEAAQVAATKNASASDQIANFFGRQDEAV